MIKYPTSRASRNLSNFGATGGENTRDLAQRIGNDQVVLCQNYFPKGDGIMEAREGLGLTDAVDGKYSMLSNMNENIIVRAYDNGSNSILETYNKSTKETIIKKTFSSREDVCGVRYGDYFYASDGETSIGFFHKTGVFVNFTDRGTYATLTGGTGVDTTVSHWTVIPDATFKITINGTVYNITRDLTATPVATTMQDIADEIYQGMSIAGAPVHSVLWKVDHFEIKVLELQTSTISFCSSTGSGTDISEMMKCRSSDG